MKRVVLLACASKKLDTRARAEELYPSTLFKWNLKYAHALDPDAIFVLSAKHGLLALKDEIEPHDETLSKMQSGARKAWANRVLSQLQERFDLEHDQFIILAGERYRQHLVPYLSSHEIPLQGLPIGKQLQFLKEQMQ
jgi:hypothetical protein